VQIICLPGASEKLASFQASAISALLGAAGNGKELFLFFPKFFLKIQLSYLQKAKTECGGGAVG
jgi:hypothetical protein